MLVLVGVLPLLTLTLFLKRLFTPSGSFFFPSSSLTRELASSFLRLRVRPQKVPSFDTRPLTTLYGNTYFEEMYMRRVSC